ncbi:MAG: L-aspartate oxidase, partial [Clostridia bacterium]|nr:L-aspartate oxidase [Clostridia bacterium]
MRRYLYSNIENLSSLPREEFDVVVVGSGVAGLFAALNLDEKDNVAILTKTDLEHSNSWQAQGGIAAVLAEEDCFQLHIEDTMTAGAGLCKEEAVRVLVEEGPEAIHTLEEWEVPFDYNESGQLVLAREGGHRLRRIAHCDGDATGRETTKRLGQIVMTRENIHPYFRHAMIDIVTDDKGVCGVVIYNEEKREFCYFASRNVILATGGIGQLYNHTTNPRGAVGDGMACAFRAGAEPENMEMVQFHPTTLMAREMEGRLFLISEAVRGEGAILRNGRGEGFMKGKHPMADLAPRDIVTREILKELRRTGEDRAYLDCSHMTREFFFRRFPNISAQCQSLGIELTRDFIPIHPAQHYFMGGVATDLNGETSVPGLFACGEVSCTGVHGANRLASNSMLECLVFSKRCAKTIDASQRSRENAIPEIKSEKASIRPSAEELRQDRKKLRQALSHAFGPVRRT